MPSQARRDDRPAIAPLTLLPRAAPDDVRHSFLRMVSHELRTPLNSIIGFSEILAHELCGPLGSPQYKEYAGLIGASGHRLLKLVNQVLEMVRLQGGTADLEIRAELLEPHVRDVFQQLRDEAAAADVRLALKPLDAPLEVLADARGLQTILTNLLQNAIAHSPAGGVVLVAAERQGGCVTFIVSDQGQGVDPEELERIRRPFEQAGQTLTRRSQGAGLGLPIASLLCEAMEGTLTLNSVKGQGFLAAVSLPAA
jgi:signal transduction histidine kinase